MKTIVEQLTLEVMIRRAAILLLVMAAVFDAHASDKERTTLSLNGTWQIAESVSAEERPAAFTHTVPVPGMVNLAKPAFPQVDWFASREYFVRPFGRTYPYKSKNEVLAKDAPLPVIGIPVQKRNYFWYRRSFTAPGKREVTLLQINKAQFGTAVFLNGKAVGENLSCWTRGTFNLTEAIRWSGENELLVRIGAHPAVLPENILGAGTCSSKHKWTPGIYDDVQLVFCNNPVIETIQVAPRLESSEVVIQTKVRNYGTAPKAFTLDHAVRTWKEQKIVATFPALKEMIEGAGEKTVTQTNRLESPRLWSPEDPFLYEVESRTGGDSQKTRFGMREYRFDNKNGIGYLNGKPYYLRGGNIELHLHFEDPLCGDRPWDRAWVKKLLADIPKKMNWNSFRFSMSPVPQMWLDIADEEGLLIQLEPLLWKIHEQWEMPELIAEFGRWMRDNWNHPSVFMWDSNNETTWNELTKIVNTVRPLDLSNRLWDNSWTPPASPADPTEKHAYLLNGMKGFDYRKIQGLASKSEKPEPGRCQIVNEYDWLWLYPDGEPLDICKVRYSYFVPNGTAEERIDYRWYMTAGMTEYYRAKRAVGVMYYEYLGSYMPRTTPGSYHFGVFTDSIGLQLQPAFEKYMIDAFKPLGVYIDFWADGESGDTSMTRWGPIRSDPDHPFSIVLVNDDAEPVTGRLQLSLETSGGAPVVCGEATFDIPAYGKRICKRSLGIPAFKAQGDNRYVLKATTIADGTRHAGQTVSRRMVCVDPTLQAGPSESLSKSEGTKGVATLARPLGIRIDIQGSAQTKVSGGGDSTAVKAKAGKPFSVRLSNEEAKAVTGKLTCSFVNEQDIVIASEDVRFKVDGKGTTVCSLNLSLPDFNGLASNKYLLKAEAAVEGAGQKGISTCLRKVVVEEETQAPMGQGLKQ